MNNNKGFINILVAVIIVVVIGVVGYFAITKKSEAPNTESQNVNLENSATNETANWQAYRNESYNFEFKYDPKFTLAESQPMPSTDALINFTNNNSKFWVVVSKNKESLAENNYRAGYLSLNSACDSRYLNASVQPEIQILTLNNIPILKVSASGENPQGVKYVSCYYLKNSSDKLVSFNSESSKKSDLAPIDADIEAILNTFKTSSFLIAETTNSNQQNWPIYRNDKYGFEFKYPPIWSTFSKVEEDINTGLLFGDSKKIPNFAVVIYFKPTPIEIIKEDFSSIIEEKEIKIQNLSAIQIKGIGKYTKTLDTGIVFDKNDNTYVFGEFSSNGFLNSVIESLKFTN